MEQTLKLWHHMAFVLFGILMNRNQDDDYPVQENEQESEENII
ncbi:MAG: hypothetical protein WBX81_01890 [Nitrososphaeraceae archaeon]